MLNPSIRVVLRQFNPILGAKIEQNLPNSTALSAAAHSAATYAGAALDEACFFGLRFPAQTGPLLGFSRATGAVLGTVTDSDGQYGFGRPSVAIQSGGDVFIASPFGTSPMVTKLSATTGTPSWYMCNTNGPYYFSLLSAFAVSGDHLWVASQSGANSKTPGAKTGSLTELNTGSGALITTLPRAA